MSLEVVGISVVEKQLGTILFVVAKCGRFSKRVDVRGLSSTSGGFVWGEGFERCCERVAREDSILVIRVSRSEKFKALSLSRMEVRRWRCSGGFKNVLIVIFFYVL